MKIDDLSLGSYNPFRQTATGQEIGDAQILGTGLIPYATGGSEMSLTVRVWVNADHQVGPYAVGTANATELLARQVEQISRNEGRNPVFVRWSSARSTPHDGWWHLRRASADYKWFGSTWVPINAEFVQRSSASAPRATWWSGGALASSYTGATVNLIAGPVGAQGLFTGLRQSAEGGIPYLTSPGINPIPYVPSQAVDDEFKGRCRVFDAISTVQANPPAQLGNPPNASWVEVMEPNHAFTGDFVMSNGLVMISHSLPAQAITAWCWDPATLTWRQAGRLAFRDGSGAELVPRTLRINRLSPEEVSVDLQLTNGQTLLATLGLSRGLMFVSIQLRPRSFANGQPWLLTWYPANGARAILYNESGIADQGVAGDPVPLAASTTYGYAGIIVPSADYPILAALHYQTPPNGQPSWAPNPPGGIYLGDIGGPAQNAMSRYWLSLTTLRFGQGDASKFVTACSTGGLGGAGWTSAVDANGARNPNVARCANATASGSTNDRALADSKPLAGQYNAYVRARVASVASGLSQMEVAVYSDTLPAVIAATIFAPNQMATSYAWYKVGTFTVPAGQSGLYNVHGFQQTTATTNTNWFFDEFAIVPLTQTDDNSGPQELWQQAMFARIADMTL